MPQSLLLPIEGNSIQQERYENQLAASEPLKKQLWQQNWNFFRDFPVRAELRTTKKQKQKIRPLAGLMFDKPSFF